MKSNRIKKILLGVLVLIAAYIWWGNLQLFQQTSPVTASEVPAAGPNHAQAAPIASVPDYQPPRINPFVRVMQREPTVPQRHPATLPPKPELPAEYELTGFVQRGQQSQAVVRIGQNGATVLSIGDSLGPWLLIEIIDQAAVLQQEKTRDTLWLEAPGQSHK